MLIKYYMIKGWWNGRQKFLKRISLKFILIKNFHGEIYVVFFPEIDIFLTIERNFSVSRVD